MTSRTAGKVLRDDPDQTAYVTEPGLVCRPGNVVTIGGRRVEVQPEWWFPYTGDAGAVRRAVSLCGLCPAQDRCLQLATVVGEQFGVWGGRLFERPSNPRQVRRQQGRSS